ncbi:NAD(+) diphosphatase [Salininema proteolyticum]|uniref:NAD(+) diphosphatase n=1 Tax=Salininema proteolyticum TaxID=1607685 RepID=A0ABV8TY09_9ACTN
MDTPFLRTPLDYDSGRRRDTDWLDNAWKGARIVAVDPHHETFVGTKEGLDYLDSSTAPYGSRIYLGDCDGPLFAVIHSLPEGLDLRRESGEWSDADVGIAMEALAVAQWHQRVRYHPQTGKPLTPQGGGWYQADEDGAVVFPKISPAVITLVHDGGDRALLARHSYGPNNRARRYAMLAGFVDMGESAEETVHREVREEVGIEVGNLRYIGSQPWPFPDSLMLAYFAEADPDSPITLQEEEISDARWFTVDEVDEMYNDPEGLWGKGVMRASTAYRMANWWIEERRRAAA